ncbi:MAG: hypothetical protein F2534_05670 [Actinobacteria bacterium]|uniref:Unannotated protein n=1 Tax=freshwater metagenome TaxID=449393 RepID=A0A6J6CIN8_9ZZZZ|nr:hypothetical protein [Actinomycetota bacterium]
MRAANVYRIELETLPWRRRATAWVITLLQASSMESTVPAWSRQAVIVHIATDRTVGVVRNELASDVDLVGELQADLEQMDLDAFEVRWFTTPPSSAPTDATAAS